jgi:hypothetical protein
LKWEKGQTLAAKRLGVGVIGASRWANLAHLPGWARDERCQIIGICDVDPQRAGEAAHRYGAVAVHDYHDLLNRDDIDIIDVVTRDSQHFEINIAVLESGKHVLSEKPVAMVHGLNSSPLRTASAVRWPVISASSRIRRSTSGTSRCRARCMPSGRSVRSRWASLCCMRSR